MIKDLVVNLTLDADRDPAADFALSIAAAFEAHIAAIAFAFDPVVTPAVLDGLSADLGGRAARGIPRLRQGGDRRVSRRPPSATGCPSSIACSRRASATPSPCSARSPAASICRWSSSRSPTGRTATTSSSKPACSSPAGPSSSSPTSRRRRSSSTASWSPGTAADSAARAIGDAMPFLKRAKAIDVVLVSQRPHQEGRGARRRDRRPISPATASRSMSGNWSPRTSTWRTRSCPTRRTMRPISS